MAKSTARSISDFLPNNDNGPSLEDSGIEGQNVIIVGAAFERRNGNQGEYTLSIITLDDGMVLHTGSSVIAEQLGAIDPTDWPLAARFVRVQSSRDRRRSYWSVTGPTE